MPTGFLQTCFHLLISNLPKGLHGGVARSILLIPGTIQGGRTRVYQVQKSTLGLPIQLVPIGHPGHRIRTPVGTQISKNLGTLGKEVPKEHTRSIESIILGR